MADVDMGLNVYEFNKNIMKQLPVMENDGIQTVKKSLQEYLVSSETKYLMMLCKERSDYTLFNFDKIRNSSLFADDVIECMENRGLGIINFEIIEDGIVIELWVKEPGQMEEAYLYYIFPADEMVIEY